MQQPDNNDIDNAYLDKVFLMEALCNLPAGVDFLQWLVRMTGANRPCMSMEGAARRDIWLTIRQYCPVEKLPLIEYEDLRQQQERVKAMLELAKLQAQENEPWTYQE